MERYTKQGKDFYFQLIHVICMLLLSLFFLWSLIVNFIGSQNLMEYLLTLMVFCFSLSIWASFYIAVRSLITRIFVDDVGIGIKRFGKVKLFINYKDVKEIGIGKSITPIKTVEKVYFSSRKLTQDEINNLDLVQNEILYFDKLDGYWKEYIEKHLNQKIL